MGLFLLLDPRWMRRSFIDQVTRNRTRCGPLLGAVAAANQRSDGGSDQSPFYRAFRAWPGVGSLNGHSGNGSDEHYGNDPGLN